MQSEGNEARIAFLTSVLHEDRRPFSILKIVKLLQLDVLPNTDDLAKYQ